MAKKFPNDYEVEVVNRTNGIVKYTIPDMQNLTHRYVAGESKTITYEELEKLSWVPGGMKILQNYLQIKDAEVAKALIPNIELEYFFNEPEVRALLTSGSLEQLQDALDFAPEGVIDMIKDMAVSLPISDMNKAQAITEQTGFDVMKAIQHNKEAGIESKTDTASKRRVSATTESSSTKTRRYNVVSKTEEKK